MTEPGKYLIFGIFQCMFAKLNQFVQHNDCSLLELQEKKDIENTLD
jgi:hypothetical protein